MKNFKRISAIVLSLVLVFSMMYVSAQSDVTVLKEIDPVKFDWTGDEVASINFSELNIADKHATAVLDGSVQGNGLSIVTNINNGNQRAANRITDDGYMLLGKAARLNTLTGSGVNQGRIYVKLDASKEEKANTAYMVKVDYLAQTGKTVADTNTAWNIGEEGNTINAESWISVVYTDNANIKTKETSHQTFGTSYNDGAIHSMYFVITDANFSENVDDNGQNKGADFKLNTYTSGTQLKIRSISVVEYDTEATITNNEVVFNEYSGGAISPYSSVMDVTTGEHSGITYPDTANVYKLTGTADGEHYVLENSSTEFTVASDDTNIIGGVYSKIKLTYWDIGTGEFEILGEAVELTGSGEKIEKEFLSYSEPLTKGTFTVNGNVYIEKIIINSAIGRGDFNINSSFDDEDLSQLRTHILGKETLTESDVTGEGTTNIVDLFKLKQLVKGN